MDAAHRVATSDCVKGGLAWEDRAQNLQLSLLNSNLTWKDVFFFQTMQENLTNCICYIFYLLHLQKNVFKAPHSSGLTSLRCMSPPPHHLNWRVRLRVPNPKHMPKYTKTKVPHTQDKHPQKSSFAELCCYCCYPIKSLTAFKPTRTGWHTLTTD